MTAHTATEGIGDEEIVRIARICHEANRGLQIATGDPVVSPPWEEAPIDQHNSALEGVRAALPTLSDGGTVTQPTPEAMHDAWSAYKRADGWTYGPTKDPERKTHPCLVPYDELPPEQRVKDAVFLAIVATYSANAIAADEAREAARELATQRYFTAGDHPQVVRLRERVVELATEILVGTPNTRNRSIALTGLEDVQMRANRAIFAKGPTA